jgi:hypothetical protein
MQTIIDAHPYRIFPTHHMARTIADSAQREDPDWTYVVRQMDRGFVVVIYDEDGEYVGNHP